MLAKASPERFCILNSEKSIDEIQNQIKLKLDRGCGMSLYPWQERSLVRIKLRELVNCITLIYLCGPSGAGLERFAECICLLINM